MNSQMLTMWILVFAAFFPFIRAACDRYYGPQGIPECVLFTPGYQDYQWAICLSDEYIRTKSQGKQFCSDKTYTYCYYQCMIEVYDIGSGLVSSDCSCSPNATTKIPPHFPFWCFTPTGTDCSWYRDCLGRYHPCPKEEVHALVYAEKFCELYNDHYLSFTPEGQRWINEVRICLQQELVTVVRPWMTGKSCDDINIMALDSHKKCFSSSASGIGYCDLGLFYLYQIFWTLRFALPDAPSETMRGFYDVIVECSKQRVDGYNRAMIQEFELELSLTSLNQSSLGRRPSLGRNEIERLVQQFVSKVAGNQRWYESGILWYGRKSRENAVDLRIDFTLASQKQFDLNAGVDTPIVVLANSTKRVKEDIKSGKLSFSVMNETIRVLSMSSCDDMECRFILFQTATVSRETSTAVTTTETPSIFLGTANTTAPSMSQSSKVAAPKGTANTTAPSMSQSSKVAVPRGTASTTAASMSQSSKVAVPKGTASTTAASMSQSSKVAVPKGTANTTAASMSQSSKVAVPKGTANTTAPSMSQSSKVAVPKGTANTTAPSMSQSSKVAVPKGTANTTAPSMSQSSKVAVPKDKVYTTTETRLMTGNVTTQVRSKGYLHTAPVSLVWLFSVSTSMLLMPLTSFIICFT